MRAEGGSENRAGSKRKPRGSTRGRRGSLDARLHARKHRPASAELRKDSTAYNPHGRVTCPSTNDTGVIGNQQGSPRRERTVSISQTYWAPEALLHGLFIISLVKHFLTTCEYHFRN